MRHVGIMAQHPWPQSNIEEIADSEARMVHSAPERLPRRLDDLGIAVQVRRVDCSRPDALRSFSRPYQETSLFVGAVDSPPAQGAGDDEPSPSGKCGVCDYVRHCEPGGRAFFNS